MGAGWGHVPLGTWLGSEGLPGFSVGREVLRQHSLCTDALLELVKGFQYFPIEFRVNFKLPLLRPSVTRPSNTPLGSTPTICPGQGALSCLMLLYMLASLRGYLFLHDLLLPRPCWPFKEPSVILCLSGPSALPTLCRDFLGPLHSDSLLSSLTVALQEERVPGSAPGTLWVCSLNERSRFFSMFGSLFGYCWELSCRGCCLVSARQASRGLTA